MLVSISVVEQIKTGLRVLNQRPQIVRSNTFDKKTDGFGTIYQVTNNGDFKVRWDFLEKDTEYKKAENGQNELLLFDNAQNGNLT